MSPTPRPLALSLFTGAGIGDVGLRAAGYEYILMSEIDPLRADLAAGNFPESKIVTGDLWKVKDQVIDLARAELESRHSELNLISCTAPCQGMSKSGRGTLLRNIRLGKRPALDPRNRLILPALDVIEALQPEWVIFENVSEMADTLIQDANGEIRPILDIICARLSPLYLGKAYNLEFANYGIPQRRKRLITVFSRTPTAAAHMARNGELVPMATHTANPAQGQHGWIAVSTVLERFPPLDAQHPSTARNARVPFHRVPLLDARKYEWVRRTPPGKGAFDNQCSKCGFDENPTHGSVRDSGVNRSSKVTPIRCSECDSVLPRPHVIGPDGEPRIMSGFTSAYKRMSPDLPAPALTRNLSYACSDQKLHPTQNRVLSLAEAFAVHTLDRYRYSWASSGGSTAHDTLIRLVLGESIPPRMMELLGRHLLGIDSGSRYADSRSGKAEIEPGDSIRTKR